MALFCAAVPRDSISLLKFPFLIHISVFSHAILPVCHFKNPYSCLFFSFLLPCFSVCTSVVPLHTKCVIVTLYSTNKCLQHYGVQMEIPAGAISIDFCTII